jgi:hypothetical protein
VNKKQFVQAINKLGWKVTKTADFRIKEVTLHYSEGVCLEVISPDDQYMVQAVEEGDILIVGKCDINGNCLEFEYKGGSRHFGELSYYLRKTGDWMNNNWFSTLIAKRNESFGYFESITSPFNCDITYNLDDAAQSVLDTIKNMTCSECGCLTEHPYEHVWDGDSVPETFCERCAELLGFGIRAFRLPETVK